MKVVILYESCLSSKVMVRTFIKDSIFKFNIVLLHLLAKRSLSKNPLCKSGNKIHSFILFILPNMFSETFKGES